MNVGYFLTNAVSAVLLPPLDLVLPCAAGFLMRRRWPRVGTVLCLGSLVLLVIASTTAGSRLVAVPLEEMAPPLNLVDSRDAGAIIILGGGRSRLAPEYDDEDQPSLVTLARLRYGAYLYRQTGLPLLASGGMPDGSGKSEAAVMAEVMREDFATPVKWKEQSSDNTAENAQNSAVMLKKSGVRRVLLVTDALHMARATMAFRMAGLDVVPAPTGFRTTSPLSEIDFIPNAGALATTHYAMHEWIGIAWYWLRHGHSDSLTHPKP
jgi:uncharacterized SAM-binding protein YcdF (DUF218 family)